MQQKQKSKKGQNISNIFPFWKQLTINGNPIFLAYKSTTTVGARGTKKLKKAIR